MYRHSRFPVFRYAIMLLVVVGLVAILLLPATATPAGNTHYVAPAPVGSDSNPGTLESPWASIQHAVDSSGPGDTIFVRGGAYYEAVGISAGGASGQPLTIAAYPGETPVLDGSSGAEWAAFQFAPGTAWVDLSGFTVTGYRTAIDVSGGNSHLSFTGLDVGGSEVGMRMTWGYSADEPMFGPVDHITIVDSSFSGNHLSGIDCTPGPCDDISLSGVDILDNGVGVESFGADGLAVEKGARISVTGVRSINNGGDGIDLNSRDGVAMPGITVSRCTVARNHRNGIKLWAGGRIENSLIYGMGLNPLSLAAFSNVSVELVNNTIAMNMWDPAFAVRDYAMTVGYQEGETQLTGINLTMVNNIFAFNTGPAVGSPTGIYLGPGVVLAKESNNLYFSREDGEIQAAFTAQDSYSRQDIENGVWAADTGQGAGDVTADPLFSDAAGADFHLLTGSPAANAGASAGAPAVDIDWRQRPRGAGYDIGAFEGGGALQPALGWACTGIYWSSYADYRARELTVEYRLANAGPGSALSLSVTGSGSSDGTTVLTALPLGLGDLDTAGSLPVTLRYRVPHGVTAFRTVTIISGTDSDGEAFSCPDRPAGW